MIDIFDTSISELRRLNVAINSGECFILDVLSTRDNLTNKEKNLLLYSRFMNYFYLEEDFYDVVKTDRKYTDSFIKNFGIGMLKSYDGLNELKWYSLRKSLLRTFGYEIRYKHGDAYIISYDN